MAGKIDRPDAYRVRDAETEKIPWRRGADPQRFYPAEARRRGLDGIVLVDLLINPEGQVLEAQVVAESPTDAGFGLAALDTAKTYEFDNSFRKLVLLTVTIEFLP